MARLGDTARTSLKCILEAVLLAAGEPLDRAALASVFEEDERPTEGEIAGALEELAEDYAERGLEVKEVASGFRIQAREEVNPWVSRLWEERPRRYSRALLETLALIAYRQPITREREWIRVVGHRDVPGKPALFGTTKAFLDYFNLSSLDDLPSLAEIKDMDSFEPELDLEPAEDAPDAETGEDEPDGPESRDVAESP